MIDMLTLVFANWTVGNLQRGGKCLPLVCLQILKHCLDEGADKHHELVKA